MHTTRANWLGKSRISDFICHHFSLIADNICKNQRMCMSSLNLQHIDWALLEQQLDGKTAQTPQKNERRSAKVIRDLLVAALHAGQLRPGIRLKEVELGDALQVSRTPLREALTQLKTERILESDQDGLRIRMLDWADIKSLYELRSTLEGMAARLAALRASIAEKHLIQQLVYEERVLMETDASPSILAQHNRKFHYCICKAASNPFLEEQLSQLAQLMVLLGMTAYSMENRLSSIITEHERINRAIQNGEAEQAEHHMRIHLESALTARLYLLNSTQYTDID